MDRLPQNTATARMMRREVLRVLQRDGIRKVHVAERVTPPTAAVYHSRGCDRLAIPIAGNHRMRLATNGGDKTISVESGESVWMPIGTWNHPRWDRAVTEITMVILPDAVQFHRAQSDGSGERTAVDIFRVDGPPPARMQRTMDAVRASRSDDAGLAQLVHALCLMAIDRIEDATARHPRRMGSKATYQGIAAYIQEGFRSGESRQEVASHFGITPNHLSRLFLEHTGNSFTHALTHLRLSYACDLLINTELRVKEVADRCGFRDANYFCRVFKKRYGRTPLHYRYEAIAERNLPAAEE